MTDTARRILLTGASGSLGRALVGRLQACGEVHPLGHSRPLSHPRYRSADLTDRAACRDVLSAVSPDVVVHAAALADVDACEKDPAQAWRLTVETTRHIADWIADEAPETRLVYISTDQVYSGPGPHCENAPRPFNVYALTKLWAEDMARRVSRNLVLRTNFFAVDDTGRGLTNWLVAALAEERAITLFEDALFNPLYAGDLAAALADALEAGLCGTFNLGAGGEATSKAAFARGLAARLGLSLRNARAGRLADVPLAAARPGDLRMDVSCLERALGRRLPSVDDGLDHMAIDLKGEALA